MRRIERLVKQRYQSTPLRLFLAGHTGVGKSTELSKLIEALHNQFNVIRLSASDLDPVGFKVFDVLLLMMMAVAENTAKPCAEGGAGQEPPKARLEEIKQWFNTAKFAFLEKKELSGQIEAGGGLDKGSPWAELFGLFARARGEVKYATTRQKEVVEYRLSQVDTLLKSANRLLLDCNRLLMKACQKEWLFIWEDFDKRIAPERVEELFVTYSNIFLDLNTHVIFNIPVSLSNSARNQLPFECFTLPDIPVFQANHEPYFLGREALRSVVKARGNLELFAEGQLDRLIVASGGNIRDLFTMIIYAATSANEKIEAADVTDAINDLRRQYRNGLGQSEFDRDGVTYEQKYKRLLELYQQKPQAKIPDLILYNLLRSRAVLEFNGKGWFGLHPLVVDVLKELSTGQPNEEIEAGGSY